MNFCHGIIISTFLAATALIAAPPSEDEKFQKLYTDHWEYLMEQYPTWATSIGGYDSLNSKWTDRSLAAIAARKKHQAELVKKIKAIHRDKLSKQERINYDLFLYAQELYREANLFPSEYLPINQMGGIQQNVARTIAYMPKRTVADYQNILRRLEGVPTLIEQTVTLMEHGLAKGITPPRVTLRDVPEQIEAQLEPDPEKNPMLVPFRKFPKSFSAKQQKDLKAQAATILKAKVLPAFQKFYTFFRQDYLPKTRQSIGMSELPNGKAWYAFRVKQQTTTSLSPEKIHGIGLAEVKRIRQQMDAIIKKTKFSGSFAEFTEFLRTDKQFYYDKPEDLIAGYRNIAKKADYKIPELFGHMPRLPYGVVAVPFYAEKSQTTAYYRQGSLKDGRPGTFFANTYDLKSRPKWEMEALTLHEAVPGHHLQITIAQEQDDLPMFRKHSGHTSFVEGWGLYSESLGEEMGFYQDPYSKFGQLTYEMWRAIRLVVDTGMHHLGWSRKQAIDFFKKNTGKSEHDIIVEIDRYIVWPGQALAYKIGELKIKELRAKAERTLANRFDIRAFHDEVLKDGAVPLSVLERKIDDWIRAQKSGAIGH